MLLRPTTAIKKQSLHAQNSVWGVDPSCLNSVDWTPSHPLRIDSLDNRLSKVDPVTLMHRQGEPQITHLPENEGWSGARVELRFWKEMPGSCWYAGEEVVPRKKKNPNLFGLQKSERALRSAGVEASFREVKWQSRKTADSLATQNIFIGCTSLTFVENRPENSTKRPASMRLPSALCQNQIFTACTTTR